MPRFREYESRLEREAWEAETAYEEWLSMQADPPEAKRDVRDVDPLDRDPADDAFDPDDPDDERLLDGYRNERRL